MTAKLIISEHDQLGGLADDDHSQYLLLAGRAGGQVAIGGTLTTQALTLQDNAVDANQIVFSNGLVNASGQNIQAYHAALGGVAPTATHLLLCNETYTGTGTKVGIGNFPTFAPSSSAANIIVSVQGNVWFDTTNWAGGSGVRALDFFPAPVASGVGSANLNLTGIITGGLLNIAGRTVTANEINAFVCSPIQNIFFGTDNTTCTVARGILVNSSTNTTGTWSRLCGVELNPQIYGVINQGLWLKGDGAGSDLLFGGGFAGNADARIFYDGSNLIIDPDNLGAGRALIGVTGDDDMLLNDIEIDGDLNHDGTGVGFYGTAPVAKQLGVAVTAAGIHAALVNLGLIT